MTHHTNMRRYPLIVVAILLAATTLSHAQNKQKSRWSRQISSYISDMGDWIPLSGPVESPEIREPIKRQAVAQPRILTEPFPTFTRPTGFSQESFPSRNYFNGPNNRQLYLQSVPSAPQNYLNEQGFGQGIRFGLGQPNFPLSQGFIAPPFFDNVPQIKQRPQTVNSAINFPKPALPLSPQAKPFITPQILQTPKSDAPKFIDGYKLENSTNFNLKKPQSLQKLKMESSDKTLHPSRVPLRNTQNAKVEREEVQLLYVPVESLNRGQFNYGNPLASPQVLNSDLYASIQKSNPIKETFAPDFGRPKSEQTLNFGQDFYSSFNNQFNQPDQVPKFSTISSPIPTIPTTTPKPKKLKPHQPPLAVFLTQEAKKGDQIKVADVLSSLKNAKTIAVLDTVSPELSPKVFIGPASLKAPESYVKFELPYLSNIEHGDRKLRQLPFFVAPLSYNTPDGFAKIPFPSPHVGSVIVNSQIRDIQTQLTPIASVIPNSYTPSSQSHNNVPKQPSTSKPTFSYFSTVPPKTNPHINEYHSNHYSFEPQTVTTVRPPKIVQESIFTPPPKQSPSYFFTNNRPHYNAPQQYLNFPPQGPNVNNYETINLPGTIQNGINAVKQTDAPTTAKPTTTQLTTTTKGTTSTTSSMYPGQLLQTHNPYSINQAFHLSTPLDYQSYFDEFKESFVTPESGSSPSSLPSQQVVDAENEKFHSPPPTYLQNYNPEIQYESEITGSRFPSFDANTYTTKPENIAEIDGAQNSSPDNKDVATSVQVPKKPSQEPINELPTTGLDADILQSTKTPTVYGQYGSNSIDYQETIKETTSSTTTTTRRSPSLRTRGRPRYTTPRTESKETTARTVVTRRPLRERRPLPPRTRYEPSKITTEKAARNISNESTTKSPRSRTRGRVQFKADNDESYESKRQKSNTKDDLAYQRDVLHQNYPVTLMERMSTVDIEAITESIPGISSTNNFNRELEGNIYDNDHADTAEQTSYSEHSETQLAETDIPTFPSRSTEIRTEVPSYVPRIQSSKSDEYFFHPRSSTIQKEPVISTTPISSFSSRIENQESSLGDDSFSTVTNVPVSKYTTTNIESSDVKSSEETSTVKTEFEITKLENNILLTDNYSQNEDSSEENISQTTPSHQNRLRPRPGSVRHYQPTSSESSINQVTSKPTKIEIKRRPVQSVTYRPAFERRRTTMRIEEIAADLKTKPVSSRTENDNRYPVYKPEPTTERATTFASAEFTTKRSQYRRRRPINSYSTTSTEQPATNKPSSEFKNRFRGRRPTERPAEKPEIQTENIVSTARNVPINRYNHRNRLSERFNKRPTPKPSENEEIDDQDSHDSIYRPKYAIPEEKLDDNEKWSPHIAADNFKPYSPNDLQDEQKYATTERRSIEIDDPTSDIITARNDYDDILISVTPASNKANKKIPDIPPTLEALVEQSKSTKNSSEDAMSTFESMLEEVMKSLEEQDENEYTSNVMKHKGGEIGEIPPEIIITSGENYSLKSTSSQPEITTTRVSKEQDTTPIYEENKEHKGRRRGFWKKVKVRPISTESIEVAESQYYSNTINQLGGEILKIHNKQNDNSRSENTKLRITTYKPNFTMFKEAEDYDDTEIKDFTESTQSTEVIPDEIKNEVIKETNILDKYETTSAPDVTTTILEETNASNINPGDMDLGTGSPDPTVADNIYNTSSTEVSPTSSTLSILDRSDSFSGIMDYLFGITSTDSDNIENNDKQSSEEIKLNTEEVADGIFNETASQVSKSNITTTESNYVPAEFTTIVPDVSNTESDLVTEFEEIKKISNVASVSPKIVKSVEENTKKIETSTAASFWDPSNVVSTSMSTEVSHETEICFRGKCIKSKDVL